MNVNAPAMHPLVRYLAFREVLLRVDNVNLVVEVLEDATRCLPEYAVAPSGDGVLVVVDQHGVYGRLLEGRVVVRRCL